MTNITDGVAYAVAHDVCTEVLEGDENLEDNIIRSFNIWNWLVPSEKVFLIKRFQGATRVEGKFLVYFTWLPPCVGITNVLVNTFVSA
jgi:hypothetical protein